MCVYKGKVYLHGVRHLLMEIFCTVRRTVARVATAYPKCDIVCSPSFYKCVVIVMPSCNWIFSTPGMQIDELGSVRQSALRGQVHPASVNNLTTIDFPYFHW